MSTLRKQLPDHNGLPVSYKDDVSDDQIKQIDDMLRDEFANDEWVTVERDS